MYVYVCDLTTYVVHWPGKGYCGTVGITPSAAAVWRSLGMVLRVSSCLEECRVGVGVEGGTILMT